VCSDPVLLHEQGFFDDHQVRQGEQGMQLGGVLGQATIRQLLMAEAVLDDVKGMLDPGPHLRQRPLDWFRQIPQAFRQCLDDAALDAMFQETSRSSCSGRLSTPV
jgi:hypothetical protein